jgi:hypothetical protein
MKIAQAESSKQAILLGLNALVDSTSASLTDNFRISNFRKSPSFNANAKVDG